MAPPRFTTVAELDALHSFFLAEPSALDAQKKRAWSDAWCFLATETDLSLDVPADLIEARLRKGDPLVAGLFQSGTGLNRYGSDTAPAIKHPWRMFMETRPKSRVGMLSLDVEQTGAVVHRLRTARSAAFEQGASLPATLGLFQMPSCGMVVADPYLLAKGVPGLRQSVAPMLASLIPNNAGRFPVLVVCGTALRDRYGAPLSGPCPTLGRFFGGRVDEAQKVLAQALATHVRGTEVELSLVVNGEAMKDYHDRHVFTRYFELHMSRSFETTASGGMATKDATMDGFSVLDPAQRSATLRLLAKIQAVVMSAPSETTAGPRRHPLFALLDEV